MISVPVFSIGGKRIGEKDVDETAFDSCVRYRLLKQVLMANEAGHRSGTACTKERSRVAGSTKKPYRQKGTGFARAGSRKSPIWRGGGVVFGPSPRDYSKTVPRAAGRKAIRSAMLLKLSEGEVKIVKDLSVSAPKTSELNGILKKLDAAESCVVVVKEKQPDLWLAARNLQGVDVVTADHLDARRIAARRWLLVSEEAMDVLEKREND